MMPLLPVAAVVLALQGATSPPPANTATTIVAHRAATPPVIDGKDNDEVWRLAPVIREFRQLLPTEDANPSFLTEAKVAYDEHNFYVFVRAFDSHPDSIKSLLARRDTRICCDQIKIMIDSYHDRRTGFEFAVNPGGVKRDYAMYGDDQQEDDAWDGVWQVATQIDSLGWTAEFRIRSHSSGTRICRATPSDSRSGGISTGTAGNAWVGRCIACRAAASSLNLATSWGSMGSRRRVAWRSPRTPSPRTCRPRDSSGTKSMTAVRTSNTGSPRTSPSMRPSIPTSARSRRTRRSSISRPSRRSIRSGARSSWKERAFSISV